MSSTNNASLINQSSGSVEWYTPAYIIKAARTAMGSIDLDPVSCAKANETVKASYYYTAEYNTLIIPWVASTLWMNHPFGDSENACKPHCTKKRCVKRGHCITQDQPGNADWINKLVSEYEIGNFEQACCITFASTSEAWFQPLYNFPICFISPRVNYIDAEGKPVAGVTKGSCVTYLGTNVRSFIEAFCGLGRVMMPTYCKKG